MASKPVIGILGGIGSGKSFVANMFGELGCLVIDADQQVRQAYENPAIQDELRRRWREIPFGVDGKIDRRAIASLIFSDPTERRWLESVLHPWVNTHRDQEMAKAANDPQVLAFVWDTPLLAETGQWALCDALVFVQATDTQRFSRIKASRNWTEEELKSRENSQWPLDKKREMANYIVVNTAEANDDVRSQVREILSRILSNR